MLPWLILGPIVLSAIAFAVTSNAWRPWLLPIGGALHLSLTALLLMESETPTFTSWLVLDPVGKVFLGFVSLLFFLCSWYAPAYLALRKTRSNRVLCAGMFLSLGMMSLVIISHHLGLMWVGMEATTLVTAPSIYFNHNARSLEATWKYLLICSVGIALALLGSFFLAYSSLYAGLESTLLFDELREQAPQLSTVWLHAAFVLLFVGYGTKMGLAPMHTWKPDAYGEAPGLIGTLLAGGLTNCSFLAILRIYQILESAHQAAYAQRLMVVMGLLSMAWGAISMARQRDIKRLLAYSSVEHMGILVFGIGIGGEATAGALLHVIHNGLTKGVLFLSAGNIHRAYGSKFTDDLKGVLQRVPFSGGMLLAGFLAITGSPPFCPFISEFQILRAAFAGHNFVAGGLFVACMFIVFIGMGVTLVGLSFGRPSSVETPQGFHETIGTSVPILAFMSLVLLLGLYYPPPLHTLIEEAAGALSAKPP